jgi:NADH-quinone oxidoreductase subunit K
MKDVPLNWFLYFAAASFCIGLIGVLVRRNAIAVLMAIEIMLNAANINLVAFWRYGAAPAQAHEGPLTGVMVALFVITIAAAEVAVGIGMILLCYRRWHAADVDRYDSMSG